MQGAAERGLAFICFFFLQIFLFFILCFFLWEDLFVVLTGTPFYFF